MQDPESRKETFPEAANIYQVKFHRNQTARITYQIILSFLNKVRYLCVVKVLDTRNNESYLLWLNRCHDSILHNHETGKDDQNLKVLEV